MKSPNKEMQEAITPAEAIQRLKDGNKRFLEQCKLQRDLIEQVKETAHGQFPFATVLSCIDSRVPVELIFDQGIGYIFNVKIAGNCLNGDILGSMEFACQIKHTKAIVVLGHTDCGAVKGACDNVKLGHLTGLLHKIKSVIEPAKRNKAAYNSSNEAFVDKVTEDNIKMNTENVYERSEILAKLADEGKLKIIGACYDTATGKVNFYE